MNRHWTDDVWVGAGSAYFVRMARDDSLHAHSLLQVAIALIAPFTVVGENDCVRAALGVVIPSGKRHRLHADPEATAPVLSLFLEPNSEGGRALRAHYPLSPVDGEIVEIDARSVAALRSCWAGPAACRGERLVQELVAALADGLPPRLQEDHRVTVAQDYIANHLGDSDSLDHVAQQLRLTTRYLRKLFDREIGFSPQRYRQWCKLRLALECVEMGASFTTAAATAGFTDSAHFSRTFRGVFGAPPSSLLAQRGDFNLATVGADLAMPMFEAMPGTC